MLIELRHITEYRYSGPIRESIMELWMQPQNSPRQRLTSFELDLMPSAQQFSYLDPFGNIVHHFDVPQPHERLRIEARASVETDPGTEPPQALGMDEWDRLAGDQVRDEGFDFLQPHGFVTETEALRAFTAKRDIDSFRQHDPLTALRRLNRELHDAFDYTPGFTGADSPIDLALSEGRGVCQDFTHIMLAICRRWGIPARYVSGYLMTRKDDGERSDPEASHAWVEVFLPSLRWVGFDPTNDILAGERHVSVAVGRDYGDVPPSRGVFKGHADSELYVAVSVRPARTAAPDIEFPLFAAPTSAPARRRARLDALREQQQQQQ